MNYEIVCGIETHIELATKTKIFCGCTTEFGGEPNTHCCPVCTGQPGSLPILNQKVVEYAIKAGLALNCKINTKSHMDRKNYVYPDLPKAYQISQYDEPLCEKGYIELDSGKRIGITRIHIEEDAGKLVHENGYTYIDYNRSGVPLIEIVSEPDISSAEEAREYAEKLQLIMRYIGISDCKMQEGSMRCDVNLSLRKPGDSRFGVRTEIKNINSLSFIQKAVMAEAERQADILDAGGTVVQQTMRYDEATNSVSPMRDKENSDDYRYFPDPDILRFSINDEKVEEIRASLPELPFDKLKRYVNVLGLPEATARQIFRYRKVAEFFEGALAEGASVKNAANLIVGTIFSNMDTEEEKELFDIRISSAQFAALVKLADEKKINIGVAQSTLQKMLESGKPVEEFIKPEDLASISDEELESLCKEAIDANPKAVADVRSGKDKAINVMFGYIMKKTGGKADIRKVEVLLRKLIGQ
ncbi:aspartyl/glutamyl-tRNA(Asn/Gln) amidotransferase subunit B [Acetivibrio thermocellus AD2]|jgi:aspartyl-tRNA(Asn)/glutamyl-tRNA(Gln) amidotransferase subunit B|uniref:Aspartyl/glutamyl-tRNA(Asn/Gln) amidotransferase subunit B n=1 Tax=Acetivibrio thermocellus AD2 TaxID=1138384 RepID=A0AB36TJS4_ACETH|nr:Asp-tRNA(Asn)/Glu-tRNA(Gln) amidotransferase subunit GatB [Acetivibrio thermocellus]ADU75331.1 glutamyl-tRNA(Gln) amidotransferase, B subunit [Acetivibrio thermocellus DSM 1313]ALX09324.1 Aspartyl/glutamyl-tRNA(Asn/Gln) amidotransferase subunit B [Acetivibrio thermocellus AD2]ANV77078.1 Aspartyl/glutamyl-tRNA(Asn/Gln) amidotransferase subunit B [Acetivibrio thermocellus DSM 2360]EIC04651.1 Aspartyl/glutamyl-tRNA(Asn/Gln) amidotransferase subunit B [Acetivibrio thermocellus YS]PFH03601.1 asp